MTTKIPRWIAIHEAGHAVAHWHVAKELFGPNGWCGFERVFVRTPEEAASGPYIDDRGRENYCSGMIEGPAFYNAIAALTGERGLMLDLGMPPEANEAECARIRAQLPKSMEAEVISRLAGPIAEAKYRRISFVLATIFGGESDWKIASACAWDFCRTEDQHGQLLEKLRRRASSIIRQNWAAVNAVADTLLLRHSLTGEEATAIIKSHTKPVLQMAA